MPAKGAAGEPVPAMGKRLAAALRVREREQEAALLWATKEGRHP